MGLLTAISTFLLGPFGVSLIVCGVAACFLLAAAQMLPPRAGFISMACGGGAFIGAYLVKNYISLGMS
ncbi:hypothetical protein D9599_19355 [Roseomonas sp. KE2513]|uniref:hypothetical protein n=1 Tax=Roseomonas sp. KE2513 TaxID=2479202 RepID=UPI0018DF4E6C|nr:hypothetical protein [Roseomonas sp. KE2513]MBI0537722.1 hypothetical protein [Roseomonas sp. KE2513]